MEETSGWWKGWLECFSDDDPILYYLTSWHVPCTPRTAGRLRLETTSHALFPCPGPLWLLIVQKNQMRRNRGKNEESQRVIFYNRIGRETRSKWTGQEEMRGGKRGALAEVMQRVWIERRRSHKNGKGSFITRDTVIVVEGAEMREKTVLVRHVREKRTLCKRRTKLRKVAFDLCDSVCRVFETRMMAGERMMITE